MNRRQTRPADELPDEDGDLSLDDRGASAAAGKSWSNSGTARPRHDQRQRSPEPEILHADEHLLVVNKPAGVLSVPGRGSAPILAERLVERRLTPPDEPFRVVHRLDKDASGVIVFARSLLAQQSLSRQFEQHALEKVYLALVRGYVSGDGEVDAPIRADDDHLRAFVDAKRGKPSRTRFRVLERLTGNTLLECRPESGRLHQIRVHLAHAGHPLSVDPVYGGASALMLSTFKAGYKSSTRHEERPLIARLTLHSLRLNLQHPAGHMAAYEAAVPKDLRATLTQLRRA